ncbi:ABC transporter permease [Streptomyces tauricus]|uniref:ABC transporter permease n=1 Tax=Streptomyces tauricus TaxID=68274 RepID=A0ABZ1JQ09_9ACTN|nr:ABC transporter permease [Streptomyces tauricus]
MKQALWVTGASAANAVADMRAVYTWRIWLFGWLGRMLAQAVFFALLGRSADHASGRHYQAVGSLFVIGVFECLGVVSSTTWERAAGTLEFISVAPSRPVWVFFGRSLQWPVSATVTTTVSVFALGPLFGVTWQPGQVPAVVALIVLASLSTYCFGLFLGALVLNANGSRNLVANATSLLMMIICGVQIPVGQLHPAVRVFAFALPPTWTLRSARAVLAGDAAVALAGAGAAVALGIVWLVAADMAFRTFLNRSRRTGRTHYF